MVSTLNYDKGFPLWLRIYQQEFNSGHKCKDNSSIPHFNAKRDYTPQQLIYSPVCNKNKEILRLNSLLCACCDLNHTVQAQNGFPLLWEMFHIFSFSTDVCCVGRCKTEGVRLNKRFVSVLQDWHRNYKELI